MGPAAATFTESEGACPGARPRHSASTAARFLCNERVPPPIALGESNVLARTLVRAQPLETAFDLEPYRHDRGTTRAPGGHRTPGSASVPLPLEAALPVPRSSARARARRRVRSARDGARRADARARGAGGRDAVLGRAALRGRSS